MCKHILNAQVSLRSKCCNEWFDCVQCHDEKYRNNHELVKSPIMILACKKCRRVFRKDMTDVFEEADEFCPFCDNRYVINAVTPESKNQEIPQILIAPRKK